MDKIQEAYESMLVERKVELPATLDSIDDYIFMIEQALKKPQSSKDLDYAENIISKIITNLTKIKKTIEKKNVNENILAQIGSMGKMPGQWGERLGTFGTVLAKSLKTAGVEVHDIKPIGKFENEITVSYKGKKKKVKLDMDSSAEKVVKKIIGK